MRDIMDEQYYAFQGFFERAQEICEYYGLTPIETPMLEDEDIFLKAIGEGTDIVDKEMYTLKTKGGDHLTLRPEGTAGVMRAYIEHGMQSRPQPVMLYYNGPFFRHDKPQKGRYRQFTQFGVEIIGSSKSILDAFAIHIGSLILKEAGIENVKIKINSLGDEESRGLYTKELVAHYRKHINKLSPTDRQRLKVNPLRILDSKDEKAIEINATAPQTVAHLNATSKHHFKEVLEYLDQLGIDYEIDHTLVRGLDYYSHTAFEFFGEAIIGEDGIARSVALGGGGRYDGLAKTMGHKKDVPAVGWAMGVDRIIESTKKHIAPKVKKQPKVYFIQLGNEAKLKSLAIIEALRVAHVPVMHSLSKDKLGVQLANAEKIGVKYVMIFGQKEAIEGSVIVRDMSDRSQKTVDIDKLADYMKKLK